MKGLGSSQVLSSEWGEERLRCNRGLYTKKQYILSFIAGKQFK